MLDITEKDAYKKKALIEKAKDEGHTITSRMIDDWVFVGLLSGPERKGRGEGEGKGTVATWPESQLRLLLSLLDKQKNETWKIGRLLNIPVWRWLEWSDSNIPLSQVRKALETWKEKHHPSESITKSRRAARQFTEMLNHMDARKTDRQALINALVDIHYRGRSNGKSLREAVEKVCGPKNTDIARLSVDLIEAKYFALSNLEYFKDDEFERARRHYMGSTLKYLKPYRDVIKDPTMDRLHRDRRKDYPERVDNACLSLITELGTLREETAGDSPKKESAG